MCLLKLYSRFGGDIGAYFLQVTGKLVRNLFAPPTPVQGVHDNIERIRTSGGYVAIRENAQRELQ